ncbi:unnamed protein product [Toxocara canis]|uniref:Transposase n=1 Tax=Toxocara canis TaxID=6265 RepID=A0A183UEZ2_TOXCA|nr:unnamed protein product [Toxocara canis]
MEFELLGAIICSDWRSYETYRTCNARSAFCYEWKFGVIRDLKTRVVQGLTCGNKSSLRGVTVRYGHDSLGQFDCECLWKKGRPCFVR